MGESGVEPDPLRHASRTFFTPEAVEGIVLVSGIVVASGSHGASAILVFWAVVATVVVFWAANVYANTIAGHGALAAQRESIGASFRRSLRVASGFLISAILPCLVLLLGALNAIDDVVAIWTALWVGVAILAVLGFIVFGLRGDSWPMRILGSLGTATFGFAMIFLKAVIH